MSMHDSALADMKHRTPLDHMVLTPEEDARLAAELQERRHHISNLSPRSAWWHRDDDKPINDQ